MRSIWLTVLILTFAVCLSAQEPWKPFTAQYATSYSVTDKNTGKTNAGNRTEELVRSADGTVLRTVLSDGTAISGKLLQGSTGQMIAIDYIHKRATFLKRVPYRHSTGFHADAPVGTETIGGLVCTGYPQYGPNSAIIGTIWIDETDEITCKREMHTSMNGNTMDYIETISNVSFKEPDPKSMEIPAGFTVLKPSDASQ